MRIALGGEAREHERVDQEDRAQPGRHLDEYVAGVRAEHRLAHAAGKTAQTALFRFLQHHDKREQQAHDNFDHIEKPDQDAHFPYLFLSVTDDNRRPCSKKQPTLRDRRTSTSASRSRSSGNSSCAAHPPCFSYGRCRPGTDARCTGANSAHSSHTPPAGQTSRRSSRP